MRFRKSDVLVQMEERDLAPVDPRFRGERAEHVELACAGGDDDIGKAVLFDGRADFSGAKFSRGFSAGLLCRVDVQAAHVLEKSFLWFGYASAQDANCAEAMGRIASSKLKIGVWAMGKSAPLRMPNVM